MADKKQGKCEHCKLRIVWEGKPLLRDALCPGCARALERTSSDMKRFPTIIQTPLVHQRHEDPL